MGRKTEIKQLPAEMPEILPSRELRIVAAQGDLVLVQAQHDSHVRAVALQLGYQLPADCTDPDLIQRDISANMRRSVEACLEVGRGLGVLKVACGHGNFMARLDVLGVDVNVAGKFMQAARRFSNSFSTTNLAKAIGNQTKLFEMLVLDDEQIEELELTGQTGELKLDDIASMSVKELRAGLREANAEAVADKEILSKRNTRIAELEREQLRLQASPPDVVLAEMQLELAGFAAEALGMVEGSLRQGMIKLNDYCAAHDFSATHVMAGHVGQLQQLLNDLREEFVLPNIAGDGTPAWKKWANEQDNLAADVAASASSKAAMGTKGAA